MKTKTMVLEENEKTRILRKFFARNTHEITNECMGDGISAYGKQELEKEGFDLENDAKIIASVAEILFETDKAQTKLQEKVREWIAKKDSNKMIVDHLETIALGLLEQEGIDAKTKFLEEQYRSIEISRE